MFRYGLDMRSPYTVTGTPPASDVYRDNVDELGPQFRYFDESGTQTGSHPAKTQPKKPDWLG